MDEQQKHSTASPSTSESDSGSGWHVGQSSPGRGTWPMRLVTAMPPLTAGAAAGWALVLYLKCDQRPLDWKILGMILGVLLSIAVGATAGNLVDAIRAWRSGK